MRDLREYLLPPFYKTTGILWAMMSGGIYLALHYTKLDTRMEMNSISRFLLSFFLFGLYLAAFSREHTENDAVSAIRLRAFFFSAFFLFTSLLAAVAVTLFRLSMLPDAGLLYCLFICALIFYLFYFNYNLYFSKRYKRDEEGNSNTFLNYRYLLASWSIIFLSEIIMIIVAIF